MSADTARLRAERALFRQSVSHHLGRERVLEGLLADMIAAACSHKCDCRASKALRALARELEETRR